MPHPEYERLVRCRDAVAAKTGGFRPRIALVLGSGLGPLAERMDVRYAVPYADVDGMPVSTVPGHAGRYLFGYIGGVPVVCMQGRVHFYEGLPVRDVVLPVRVMGLLGARTLFLTNAAGGVDPAMPTPSLMVIADHILFGVPNPLAGPNIDELGPRFPDMSAVYDPMLRALLLEHGHKMGLPMSEGVYIQMSGPSFETPAEIRMAGLLGAGAVGMSTAVEAVAARHMGLRVCGVSCITNKAAGLEADHTLTHAEVMAAGDAIAARFSALTAAVIPAIDRLTADSREE